MTTHHSFQVEVLVRTYSPVSPSSAKSSLSSILARKSLGRPPRWQPEVEARPHPSGALSTRTTPCVSPFLAGVRLAEGRQPRQGKVRGGASNFQQKKFVAQGQEQGCGG